MRGWVPLVLWLMRVRGGGCAWTVEGEEGAWVRTGEEEVLRVRWVDVGAEPCGLEAKSLDGGVVAVSGLETTTRANGSLVEGLLTLRGVFLGRATLRLTAVSARRNVTHHFQGMMLGQVFTIIMALLIAVNTFLMGTQLDSAVIKDTLRYPVGPIIGMSCQFLLMPVLSFLWGKAILAEAGPGSLALGYFAIGCSPGGGNSNFWTILLEGNLDLSVTMTFLSSILAFLAMPAWFYTLGRYVHKDAIGIPFFNMGGSLAILVLPCIAGFIFANYHPLWKASCRWLCKASSLLMLLFVVTVGTAANLYVFHLIRWETVVAGFLLPWTGYACSWAISILARRNPTDALTIAIETGIQNGGVSILVLRFSLDEPESDLTLVMPICVMLFTTIPLWVLLIFRYAKHYLLLHRQPEAVTFTAPESTSVSVVSTDTKAVDFYTI